MSAAPFKPFSFRGHAYQYEEFRRKNEFVDCEYHDNQNTYKAHKIILSYFSTLLRDYFIKNPVSSTGTQGIYQLPIPYNSAMFNDFVDFLYKNKLVIDKIDSSKLLPWLSMGYVYDVYAIREIIEPIIQERFLQEPKDEDLDTILKFSEYYKKIRLNDSISKDFDHIEENLQRFTESQKLFVEYLSSRFYLIEDERKKLAKLTPYLLSEILKSKDDYSDVRKARILENYIKFLSLLKEQVSIDDRRTLQNVIDWTQDDAYKLFTYNKLDWVLPEVARPQIVKLIKARRNTLKSLENDHSLKSSHPINHWYAISCVNKIETAHETTGSYDEPNDYSIIHFIGTLGNSNKVSYINPKRYHFLDPDFSESLMKSMEFGNEVVFDEGQIDPKCHFLSKCIDLTNKSIEPPFVGFQLPGTGLLINRVEVTSSVTRETDRPQAMILILDDKVVQTSPIQGDKITFHLSTPQRARRIKVQIDPNSVQSISKSNQNSLKSAYFALRVHRLQVFGDFLPS